MADQNVASPGAFATARQYEGAGHTAAEIHGAIHSHPGAPSLNPCPNVTSHSKLNEKPFPQPKATRLSIRLDLAKQKQSHLRLRQTPHSTSGALNIEANQVLTRKLGQTTKELASSVRFHIIKAATRSNSRTNEKRTNLYLCQRGTTTTSTPPTRRFRSTSPRIDPSNWTKY